MIVFQDKDANRTVINPTLVAKAQECKIHQRIDVWLINQESPVSIVFATPKLTVSAFDAMVRHYDERHKI